MTLSAITGPPIVKRPLGKLLSTLAVTLLLGSAIQAARAQTTSSVNVTTYHNDKERTGLNSKETILTPANVNTNSFGMLFTLPVDSYVYAQPLYLSQVAIPGSGTHNVVYIATEHNSIYAYDADSNLGANSSPLWQVNLGPSVPYSGPTGFAIPPENGITSTPVIDPGTKTLYVVARTEEKDTGGNPIVVQRLHALDVTTGTEKFKGPVVISATVKGTGDGTDGNGNVPFNPLVQLNRPALLLTALTKIGANGKAVKRNTVFIGFASISDLGPYHGWVFGYDAATLKQVAVFNTSPNATTDPSGYPLAAGGIWMAGAGLASDGNSLYYITGNGTFDPSTGSYGDSFVRMSTTNGLQLADYFTPMNQQFLNDNDEDLGSGGCILLPAEVGSKNHPQLMIGAGKLGNIYLVDRTNMGQFNPNLNAVVGEVDGQMGGGWGGPAYFNHTVYYGGNRDSLKAFSIKQAVLSAVPTSVSSTHYAHPGTCPSVSSNGTTNGIVWTIQTDGYTNGTPGVLHAYKATDLTTELYNSSMIPGRDTLPKPSHFATPTIANGKVYVVSQYGIGVFGNGQWVDTPTISPAPGAYSGTITITISDTTPGADIYYTLHGATPSSISFHYTGPFTLSSPANVQAIAYAPGYYHSGIASSQYLVNAVVGNGTGLQGSYYANSLTPTGTPTNQELDPTINFNWNGGPPGNPPFTSFPGTHWSAEWTGTIESETTDRVTFTTVSNDGIRLWVNNQELINQWVDQTGTFSATISLVAGTKYPITIDYYQDVTGSQLQLFWSFPGQAMQIVPQSQLYPPN